MEVAYFPGGGSITDYTCEIFNTHIGVSVTRAMKYKGEYTLEDANRLLNKKLNGKISMFLKILLSIVSPDKFLGYLCFRSHTTVAEVSFQKTEK